MTGRMTGDEIVFTTGETTMKGKALRRDPRVALCFDDEAPPLSFVIVEGEARISEDATELLVHVHPTRIVGQRDVSG